MTDEASPTLLLTRPGPQSAEFLALCERAGGRRLPAVISPILRIVAEGDLPDLDAYATVIVTSGNAVGRLDEAGLLAGRRVAAVGERTAALARAAGAEATCLGETVEAFLACGSRISAPAVHCRGVHSRGALANRLTEAGTPCDEAVVYDQVPEPLSPAARRLLSGAAPVVLPLFSPRSARLLAGAGGLSAPLRVLAISAATAEAWTGPGIVEVAPEPTADAMCSMTIDAF